MKKTNSLPQNAGLLIQLGGKAEEGIKNEGASVPIVLVTATQVHDDTQAFSNADHNFNAGRSAEQAASNAFQATLLPLYAWLLSVSNMLASRFGTRWNTAWAQAGFINHTTAIPVKVADRITLALRLVQFFVKSPGFEVPSMKLTAAEGTILVTATQTAQAALSAATAAQKTVGSAWTAAYNKLVGTLTELLKNLEAKLKADDTRWLAFGFRIPATIKTPGQPQNLTAHLDSNGQVVLQNDAVPTATRYRYRKMILGVDFGYSFARSSKEPMVSVGPIQPGQTAQFIVQAVSGNLQGVASEPITFTMPFVAKTADRANAGETAATAPTVLDEIVIAPATNGSNGHANGHRAAARH